MAIFEDEKIQYGKKGSMLSEGAGAGADKTTRMRAHFLVQMHTRTGACMVAASHSRVVFQSTLLERLRR